MNATEIEISYELPPNEANIEEPATSKSKNGKYCPICKKVLPPEANLSFHQMLHPWTETPHACDDCLFVSLTREELSEHCKKVHPSNRKFICAICSKEFTNIRTLNKHKPIHALVLPFSCAYCDKGFPEYGYWRQHEVAHKTARFQCEDCQVRFTTAKYYKDHRQNTSCKTTMFECCSQVLSTRMDYVKHCFDNHRFRKTDEHACSFCGRLYAFKCLMTIHMKQCKLRTNKPEPKPKSGANHKYKQTEVLEGNTNLELQDKVSKIKTNEPRKLHQCDLCDKTFLTKSWLRQHKMRHIDPNYKQYNCTLCNKTYSTYSALYYHKHRTHLQVKRFKCDFCEKTFYDSQSLKDHLTLHTGERPYACDYCPKKFRSRSTKIEHHRVHTGQRPYNCKYCTLSFKRRDAKLSHERRHTGEKPFKCRVCDRPFAQDSTMRSHERKHQPPFSCTLCEEVFTNKDTLVLHKRNHVTIDNNDNDKIINTAVQLVMNNDGEWHQPVEMAADTEGNVYIQYQFA